MGYYTDNLFKKNRQPKSSPQPKTNYTANEPPQSGERLVSAAIIRDGVCTSGPRSHSEVRRKLGDSPCYDHRHGDKEGFVTSTGRFVDRETAKRIGIASGQCQPMQRELLSSDVRW